MKTRVCTKCGEEKPETTEYFYRHKASRGGLDTTCKVCHNKKTRKWRDENPEKQREYARRWQAENPEKVRDKNRRWRAENPEKVREAVRRWQSENPEKQREYTRRWQAKYPEKQREANNRCRNTLAPCYLKTLISAKYNIDISEIGEELVEAKRREIAYYRQLKQLKQLK
jgi:hypothetical protein